MNDKNRGDGSDISSRFDLIDKMSKFVFAMFPMESLVALPEKPGETNVVRAFMNQVKTDEARKGIEIADKLIDMYLFHSRVHNSGVADMSERSSL